MYMCMAVCDYAGCIYPCEMYMYVKVIIMYDVHVYTQ